jgi:glyoxylase-like metal-dependent hydrolase (beta-lactamase superfamily II)
MRVLTLGGDPLLDWPGDRGAAPAQGGTAYMRQRTYGTVRNAEAERRRRRSEIRSVLVGEIAVTYLPDGMIQINPIGLYPETTASDWSAEYPEYLNAEGYLTISSGALLIENGGRAMLLDSGYGPTVPPAHPGALMGPVSSGDLLASLASTGRRPEDIEAIAFSHLHMDHVGWAALPLAGNPFRDTTCLVHEPEWRDRHPLPGVSEEMLANLEPRVAAVADGEEIFPGVRVQALPGHTQGHAGFRISSQGQELVAFGDIMHSAFQVVHPQLKVLGDSDPDKARRSRFEIVTELAATNKIGYGCHFADVVFGHVRHTGKTMVWIPMP